MDRRGSYIAEAAVVLPVIILTVITAVLIVMFFYSQTGEQALMHMAMREEAGRISGKSFTSAPEWDGHVKGGGRLVEGRKDLMMDHRLILRERGAFTLEDRMHVSDGTGYVRKVRAALGVMR